MGPGTELQLVDMWEYEGDDPYYAETHAGLVEKAYEQVKRDYGVRDNAHLVLFWLKQWEPV